MSIHSWIGVVVIILTIWALIKRWETRMVLIAAGLFLCIAWTSCRASTSLPSR